jgi:hypothetical protein
LLERIRMVGVALIVAALSVSAWKTLGGSRQLVAREGPATAVPPAMPGARAEWTIPVEIVETGEAPRLHEVRVNR